MDVIISDLLQRFERGALTRRGFIQGLAMLTASAAAPAVGQTQSAAMSDTAIRGVKIDHVSIQVGDLPRSVAFYERVFGMKVLTEVKDQEIVRLGAEKFFVSLHHKSPTGLVDHFAIGVENFNRERVTQQLKQLGIAPEENQDAGYHVTDPAGISVQIVPA
jgi:catechol 2,3-dioxygenase-like lactoylglutathione lyase family enzyme